MINEHGIVFSAPMVAAILSGLKTMSRRVISLDVNVTINYDHFEIGNVLEDPSLGWEVRTGSYGWIQDLKCPFGVPGDLLWVREDHFCKWYPIDRKMSVTYRDKTERLIGLKELPINTVKKLHSRKTLGKKWVSCRFMPKAFARIWLETFDVAVEHLNDISESDALREGVLSSDLNPPGVRRYLNYLRINPDSYSCDSAIESFITLWDSLHGIGSWSKNPHVFVGELKIISTTGRPATKEQEAISA